MPSSDIADAVELIRMEYAEMPGLSLTFWQAQRLWNLSEEVCQCARCNSLQPVVSRRVESPACHAPRVERRG